MPPAFMGCTILGDGEIVPLVHAMGLLRWIDNRGSQPSQNQALPSRFAQSSDAMAQSPYAKAAPAQKNLIMVVDDSINVRRFLALTLEKAGYQVEQAKDGQDAIEKLQGGLTAQAVICEMEMPRLDGYGFLSHVRSNPSCKHLPVVMLTSRSGDKHRQLAMNMGATGYFSKPFQQQELLQPLQ
ncbi:MAG: hypothetical protein BRC48_14635 [Cyanobacteria bacterium QS_9_48_30]|jgi:chemosensory pili system protein ChpA (sensor histidine kinase/response regulator)|nr:MAG: hypothetical protein BRC48_14635 [Cyanobacteria bacterium QS_9_48_30]